MAVNRAHGERVLCQSHKCKLPTEISERLWVGEMVCACGLQLGTKQRYSVCIQSVIVSRSPQCM